MNKYVQLSDEGIEFNIVTFAKDNKAITLLPVMHVASEDFYDSIYAYASRSDINVLEGKKYGSAESFEIGKLDYNYIKDMSIIYYKATKLYLEIIPELLGLSKQKNLYYKIKDNLNFVYADIDVDKQNFSPPYYESLAGIVEKLEELTDMACFEDREALYEKYYRKFSESAINSRGMGNSDFGIRNEIAIKTVKELLKKHDSISIIYGFSHINFFNDVIERSGFLPEKEKWILALPRIKPYIAK